MTSSTRVSAPIFSTGRRAVAAPTSRLTSAPPHRTVLRPQPARPALAPRNYAAMSATVPRSPAGRALLPLVMTARPTRPPRPAAISTDRVALLDPPLTPASALSPMPFNGPPVVDDVPRDPPASWVPPRNASRDMIAPAMEHRTADDARPAPIALQPARDSEAEGAPAAALSGSPYEMDDVSMADRVDASVADNAPVAEDAPIDDTSADELPAGNSGADDDSAAPPATPSTPPDSEPTPAEPSAEPSLPMPPGSSTPPPAAPASPGSMPATPPASSEAGRRANARRPEVMRALHEAPPERGGRRDAPNLVSSPSSINAATLDERSDTLVPNLDSTTAVLRINNLYTRPGVSLSPPVVDPNPTFQATMEPYAFVATDAVYLSSVNANLAGTLYADGTGLSAYGYFIQNGMSTNIGGVVGGGALGVLAGESFSEGTELMSLGASLFVWRDSIRGGISFIDANAAGVFGIISLYATIGARRDLVDLGDYVGGDAKELAAERVLKFPEDGLRRIEITQNRSLTGSARGGGGILWAAALGRVDAGKGTQTIFRTLVSRQQAHDMVFEGSGLPYFVKGKLRALKWCKEVIPIPDQKLPDTFKLGDEVVVKRTGTFTVSAVVGNLAVWGGVQLFLRGEVEVTAHKLSNNLMEVKFSPTHVQDLSNFVYSPLGPEVDLGDAKADSFRQTFVFDLNEPAGRAAYLDAIAGKLPSALHKFTNRDLKVDDEQRLADMLRKEATLLPKGVQRPYMHLVLAHQRRWGGGAHWAVVPPELLPEKWETSLTWHWKHSHEQQTVTDGHVIDAADNRSFERHAQLLMHGLHRTQVSAQQRWITTELKPKYFYGLTLQATIVDTCVRGLSYNRNMVDKT